MSNVKAEYHPYPGVANLEAVNELVRYNEYVYKLVQGVLPKTGVLLELGSGQGEFTKRFFRDGRQVDCVELDPAFHPRLLQISNRVVRRFSELDRRYTGGFSINVLEHIENDTSMLRELHEALEPGGVLSLFLPAHPLLFSRMDERVGHFRRYRRKEIIEKVRGAGFRVLDVRMVDCLGFFVSLLYKWFHRGDGILNPKSMTVYDAVVFPCSRILDPLLGWRLGRNIFLAAIRE